MSFYRVHVGAAFASSIAMVLLISGCQTQPEPKHAQAAPVTITKGTLVAASSYSAYAYIDGKWSALLGSGPDDNPSDPFQNISSSPGGTLSATTVGSNDDSLIGNQVELWVYSHGWKHVSVNNDETVAKFAWSPANTPYVIPDDGQTAGIWYQSGNNWRNIKGSSALGFINSIQFSPKGTLTVTAQASDGSATVVQYVDGRWITLDKGNVPFAADGLQVMWSPQGVLTLATSQHGVWMYQNGTWTQPGGINSPIHNVTQLGWSPQGVLFISGDSGDSTGLWAFNNGQWSQMGGANTPIAKDEIRQFGWSPSGVLTVSDFTTGTIDQFDGSTWTKVWNQGTSNQSNPLPVTFGWSPSGVLTCNGGQLGGLWQYQSGKWMEVGGANAPLKSQTGIVFDWTK